MSDKNAAEVIHTIFEGTAGAFEGEDEALGRLVLAMFANGLEIGIAYPELAARLAATAAEAASGYPGRIDASGFGITKTFIDFLDARDSFTRD